MTSLPLRWILANFAPVVVVALTVVAMGRHATEPAMAVLGHVAIALTVAMAQGVVLARHGYPLARWAVATVVGITLGVAAGIPVLSMLDQRGLETLGLCLGLAIFGAVLGAAHAQVLRRAGVRAWWWVAGSSAAWMLAGGLWAAGWRFGRGVVSGEGLLSPLMRLYETGFAELVLLGAGFAIYGALTAAMVGRLPRLAVRAAAPA
jgi:hypothetical protein